MSQFLNRRAGYGLEISYVYKLYGPKPNTDKVLNIVKSLDCFDFENPTQLCASPSIIAVPSTKHGILLSSRGAYAHMLGVLQLECLLFGGSKPL